MDFSQHSGSWVANYSVIFLLVEVVSIGPLYKLYSNITYVNYWSSYKIQIQIHVVVDVYTQYIDNTVYCLSIQV